MKYLKMLGLAAVAAMAFMAFVGSSSASADVLCTTNTTPACSAGWRVTTLVGTLKAKTSALLTTTAGETLVSCTESSVEGKDETGSETAEPSGAITALTWGGCSSTVDTLENGSLEVKTVEISPGVFIHRVIGKKSRVTVSILGVSCVYGTGEGTTVGELLVGSPAQVEANAIVKKIEGGFLCPETPRWKAIYQITNHTGVWVSKK